MLRPIRRTIPAPIAVLALLLAFVPLWGAMPGFAQENEGEEQLYQPPATPTATDPAIPPEMTQFADDWPTAQGNLSGTRAASNSPIDASTVDQLDVAWTFPLETSSDFGGMTAIPIVAGDTVYVQDMQSNVFALDRASGTVKWEKRYDIPTVGPNGLAIGYGLVYGGLGDTAEAFALDAETGDEVWRVDLDNNPGIGIDMAPVAYAGILYISTVPGNSEQFYEGGQRGVMHALDARTGAPLWSFDTTTDNLWHAPRFNSGGGLWYPPSIDEDGNIYVGVGNASPWPGNRAWPNGSSRPGPNDYASSIVSLDPATGGIRWYHNAKPHDLFDLDFQNTPVLATVNIGGQDRKVAFGSGKTGTVIAYDADTGEILWQAAVGTHQNDQLRAVPPGQTVRVYPGSLGGVETPIAYADGTVFVPIVNRWTSYTATERVDAQPYPETTGELVALDATDGSVKWTVEQPIMNVGGATVANDLVFTGLLDGTFAAYDVESGDEVWSYQASAGINAQPAIAGDLVVLPAAGPFINGPEGVQAQPAVVAFRLGALAAATPAASPAAATPVAADEEGATPVAGQPSEVTVDMVDIDFNPNEFTVPADQEVTVRLPNLGSIVHNFNIDALDVHSGDVQPGQEGTAQFTAAAGDYEYYCSIPGHKAAGMVGTMTAE